MNVLRRNLRFISMLIRMKLAHLMVFRLSFFGGFLVDGTMFVTQLLMFSAIYGHLETIGDWGRGEMLFFLGTFSLINALNMTVYFFGLGGIPGKVKSGDLDLYLTKPANPLLRLTFEGVDPGSAPLILLSIAMLGYGASIMGVTVTVWRILGYTLLVLLMTLLYYDMEVILRTLAFFFISAAAIGRLEGELIDLCMKLPGTVLRGAFRLLFCLILPYGIMATIPTQFFAGLLSPGGFFYAIGLTAAFTAFTLWFWRFGLRHYKSASS